MIPDWLTPHAEVVGYGPGGPIRVSAPSGTPTPRRPLSFRQALDRAAKPYIYKSTTTGRWTVIYGDRPTRRFSSWSDAIASIHT